MKEIKLTRGFIALIDDDDFQRVNHHKWYPYEKGRNIYAIRNSKDNGKHTTQSLHQFILGINNIDHIDRIGLNCQKHNLRPCSKSENAMNQRKQKGCSSEYKGVNIRSNGIITSQIKIAQKITYLGSFKTEIEAAKAYDAKAKELFGEFAYLNFTE